MIQYLTDITNQYIKHTSSMVEKNGYIRTSYLQYNKYSNGVKQKKVGKQ